MSSNRVLAFASAVVIVAILALGWFVGISPFLAGAAQASAERESVDQSNRAQEARLGVMRDQFDNLAELEEELQALRLSVPGEFDSDVVSAYLSGIQNGTGATVSTIVIGEAVAYGQSADGSASSAGTATVEGLYTVPVTITFDKGVSGSSILAFAGALQNGPRLFLVTAVTRPSGGDDTSGSITAYMFVVPDDRDESPGSSAGALDDALSRYEFVLPKEWGAGSDAADDAAPTPESEPTEAPTPSPTSTP